MARKSSQPALYEKMRARQPYAPQRAASEPSPSSSPSPRAETPLELMSADEPDSRWLSPGQALRVPTGYVMLGCGVCVLLVAAAYMVGHQRGEGVARTQYEQKVVRGSGPAVTDPLQSLDPLDQPGGGGGGGGGSLGAQPSERAGTAPPKTSPTVSGQPRPPNRWGPITSATDPRTKGLNYWVMAETNKDGAIRLVEHARSSGLETYAVPAKNGLFRVIAFPGFDLSKFSRTSPEVTAVRDKIYQIGASWKREKRGYGDLRDAYLHKYDG